LKNRYLRSSKSERINLCIKIIIVTTLLNYIYYRNLLAYAVVLPVGIGYGYFEYKELIDKKRNQICSEFKEFMLLCVTNLRAGYSIENSMVNTKADLINLFGEKSIICLLVDELITVRGNHGSFKEVFSQMGESTRIEDISEFAEVYEIAYKGSGNMNTVMDKCASVLVEKLEIKNDIYISLSERIFEMKIMCMMPYLIIGYISLTSPGYFDSLYQEWFGRIIMTICMLIYVAAYAWSKRLIDIDV